MRVAVFGRRGWIGGQLVDLMRASGGGWDLVEVPDGLRADDAEGVAAFLSSAEPSIDRVIAVVGRTHGPGCGTIDYLEGDADAGPTADRTRLRENVRDNLYAPLTLALVCADLGIHFSYVGTGCIFDGGDGYTEDDDPDFFGSAYSVVKGFTDRIFRQPHFRSRVLQVRIRMPVSAEEHPRNFVTKIASYDRVVSVPNSLTVLPSLLPRFVELVRRGETGTYNLTNPGVASHAQILDAYREIVDPGFQYALADSAPGLRARRSNNHLSTAKLEAAFPDDPVPGVDVAIRACLSAMAASRKKCERPDS